MIRFAAFDLDGTLLDSLPDLTDGVNYALEREGLARRTEEEVRSFIGSGVFVLLEKAAFPHTCLLYTSGRAYKLSGYSVGGGAVQAVFRI